MQWNEFENILGFKLNEQQKKAVMAVDGPTLLLAVPGSGKTTVLVTRLGYMIFCKGIDPSKILTVTYTIAATKDMSRRFASYFGEEMAEKLEFRTINGICAKIIQYYGKCIGRTPFELIKDEKMTTIMLSEIYQKSEHEYPTESDLKTVRTLITYIKNMMLDDGQIQKLDEENDIKISAIFKEYTNRLKEHKLMDYDDQMVYAYMLLRKDKNLLQHFRQMYPYICVDEAQDTSKIQHAIIALLTDKAQNIFMVGDEDQSIYGFRAAYPKALLSFEKNYPDAKVLLMEENFRSNADIVTAADQFIQKNTMRHAKHMTAGNSCKGKVRQIDLNSRMAQYTYLLKVAEECRDQTAVLYRDNECALPLIDLLERNNVPYRMRNAELTFFSHRVVVDITNIINFALNPKDTDIFLKIYYKLSMYIKKQDAIEIARISDDEDISVFDAALKYNELGSYVIGKIKAIKTHLMHMLREPADKALNRIVHFMGYDDYLQRSGISNSKIDILKAIGKREPSAGRLLERLDELKDIIKNKETDYDCPFILSTIHASKGLEYDNVYIIDAFDGILPEKIPTDPKKASKEELEEYEEARRLFYVAVTRAKNNLSVFTTDAPSGFVDEFFGREIKPKKIAKVPDIDQKIMERARHKVDYGNAVPGRYNAIGKNLQQKNNGVTVDEVHRNFESGMNVIHKKFGAGVVDSFDEGKIRINFDGVIKVFIADVLINSGMLE